MNHEAITRRKNNPTHVPCVVHFSDKSTIKISCPRNTKVSEFLFCVRKNVKTFKPYESMILLVENVMLTWHMTMGEIDEKYGDKSDYLHVKAVRESVFG